MGPRTRRFFFGALPKRLAFSAAFFAARRPFGSMTWGRVPSSRYLAHGTSTTTRQFAGPRRSGFVASAVVLSWFSQ